MILVVAFFQLTHILINMNTNPLIIANTIRNQIGASTLMCIGAHKVTAMPSSDKRLGGLMFQILPNPKMKSGGMVMVELMGNDTYTVTIKDKKDNILYNNEDIYCDMLGGPHGVIEQVTG